MTYFVFFIARLAGKCLWWEFRAVITVLGNTPNFAKVGNTGKYEILELFLLNFFLQKYGIN